MLRLRGMKCIRVWRQVRFLKQVPSQKHEYTVQRIQYRVVCPKITSFLEMFWMIIDIQIIIMTWIPLALVSMTWSPGE